MFEAKVYTTAILSLSGMMDETHTARETVSRFNQQHAASTGRLFLPVDDPQAADVVIGLVDNWVGDTRAIDHCLAAGRSVVLLFNAFADPGNTIESEHQAVAAFRERVQNHCRCLEYRGTAQLRQRVEEAIEALIIH